MPFRPTAIHQGIGVSPGIVIGTALRLESPSEEVRKRTLDVYEVPREAVRLEAAIQRTARELQTIRSRLTEKLGDQHAYIIEAHLLILKDEMLIKPALERIHKEKVNAEYALHSVMTEFLSAFSQVADNFMLERGGDIRDVVARVIQNLAGAFHPNLEKLYSDYVIIAKELTPSQTAQMDKEHVVGFATEYGGETSHTAILSRALEIPAVVGVEGVLDSVRTGDKVIIDGEKGILVLHPDEEILENYRRLQEEHQRRLVQMDRIKRLPPVTRDGYVVEIAANIELAEEVLDLESKGAEAIGLYRTEYLYLQRRDLPPEEEQYQAYSHLLKITGGKKTVIRTLDLGADKIAAAVAKLSGVHDEPNPALGLRAIRLCLKERGLFKVQLRALLRASIHGNLHILIPFVSNLEEVHETRKMLEETREELLAEGVKLGDMPPLGVMIEIPAAAFLADALAEEVDFFTIGTNDLIQYCLAVDRDNDRVAYLYQPLHPAVIRIIHWLVRKAHDHGLWVGVCGEVAGEPLFTLVLLGLGVDELSMNPISIPRVKNVIVQTTYQEARDVANEALKLSTYQEIKALLENTMSMYHEKAWHMEELEFEPDR